MPNIKSNEVKTISDILLDLYSIDDPKELKKNFLTDIKMLVPYDQSSFQTFALNNDNMIVDEAVFVDVDENMIPLFNDINSETDYLKNLFNHKNSIVYVETDILNQNVRKNAGFYKTFLKPQNLEYSCGIVLIKDRKNLGIVSLFRSEYWGDFDEKEVFILDILKSHLANMVINCMLAGEKPIHIDNELLTAREKEITELILKGYTNEEIADTLSITVSTTKKHVYNIFNKYGVNNRMSLIKTLHYK